MKIDRSQLILDLVTFATTGSGVVIGQPGVGKTYALGELRAKLKDAGILHLILPVERLGAASDPEISNVLQRDGDFIGLLRDAVIGAKGPAVLIFDGFDAARGESERAGVFRMILRAVNELRGMWHTIVSVRTFDARKSQRLLELFPAGSSAQDGGATCRKFSIPTLRDEEVQQACGQIRGLKAIHDAETPEFRALLTIPFHLWLIERVLHVNASASEFSQVTSEVQLLELYWKYRVRRSTFVEDREYLLREATKAMVESHTLTVKRTAVYQPQLRDAWNGLLSDEVLVEVPEGEPGVAFCHNSLFDFAVSVYLLDAAPEKLASFVAEEPARPLFLRPSLVYHFTRLWHFDRDGFWRNFWKIIQQDAASLRQIIRIVLPAVLIQEARSTTDLSPLQAWLESHTAEAHNAVAFTLQALRVLRSGRPRLWSSFLRLASAHLDRKFAWDAGMIATTLLEQAGTTDVSLTENCGEIGRRLLAWAWGNRKDKQSGPWFERLAGVIAVPLVAKTFATDKAVSGALLQQVLEIIGESDFPIDCIFRLVNEVEHFIVDDPELVGCIYDRVFGYEERSDAKTNIGGPVLSLISNRRQDFESCRYSLIQEFPNFLAKAPLPAIAAGIRAVQAHAIHDHVERSLHKGKTLGDTTFSFPFRGGTAYFLHDHSAIWDESSFPDQELSLADAIFKWLEAAAKNERGEDLDAFLAVFVRDARAAFLWARLLVVGAEQPKHLGPRLWELAAFPSILDARDTLVSLGAFLEHAVSTLNADQRAKIEKAILAIPAKAEADDKEWAERRRNRLLARIPEEELTTEVAKALRAELQAADRLPPNTPLVSFSSTSRPYSEDERLREQGVEPDSPKNAEMRALYHQLSEWEGKKEPERIDALLPVAVTLDALLEKPSDADAAVKAAAVTHLASFASDALLRTKQAGTDRYRLLRKLILNAARSDDPQPDPKADTEWTFAAWSPAPRNEAAQVLPWLTHLADDREALDAILTLAGDPVPSVRFLLASELWRLHEHFPTVLWPLLDERAVKERNGVVLQGIAQSLWPLIDLDPERSRRVMQQLLTREESNDEDDDRASTQLISMVVDYAVERDDEWAKTTIALWRSKPLEFASSLAVSGGRLIEHIKPQHPEQTAARARALLLEHLDAAAMGVRALQKHTTNIAQEVLQKKWRSLYGIINNTVMRLYFAADIDPKLRQRTEHPLSDETREQFFRASLPLLRKVLSFGSEPEAGVLLAPTAHYFMEFLNGTVRYNPALVLSLAAAVVASSKRFNYTLDSMAMRETVRLVETLLADFRAEIQGESSINDLLGLLDSFVEVSWPDALNLVWRLDEIYR